MMKTYARIDGGKVAELLETDGDITTMFHPDLIWIDCTTVASISVGWIYSGGNFLVPDPPSAGQRGASRITAIDAELDLIDRKTARAARDAILANDHTRLTALETQASALRTERKTLTGA
jgi:hypothetical protein